MFLNSLQFCGLSLRESTGSGTLWPASQLQCVTESCKFPNPPYSHPHPHIFYISQKVPVPENYSARPFLDFCTATKSNMCIKMSSVQSTLTEFIWLLLELYFISAGVQLTREIVLCTLEFFSWLGKNWSLGEVSVKVPSKAKTVCFCHFKELI